MNNDQIKSLVRAALVALGGALVKHGYANESTVHELLGYAAILGPIAWSMIEKREGAKLDKALAVVNDAMVAGNAMHVAIPGEQPAVAKTLAGSNP